MKDYLKAVLCKIGNGFLFGIGLVAAATVSSYFLYLLFNDSPSDPFFVSSESNDDDFEGELDEIKDAIQIVNHSDKTDGNKLVFIGKVHNTGKSSWNAVNLQVELFDKDQFVYECDEYLNKIGPEDEENFLISCGGCQDFDLPKYDRYTIRVVSGYKR